MHNGTMNPAWREKKKEAFIKLELNNEKNRYAEDSGKQTRARRDLKKNSGANDVKTLTIESSLYGIPDCSAFERSRSKRKEPELPTSDIPLYILEYIK